MIIGFLTRSLNAESSAKNGRARVSIISEDLSGGLMNNCIGLLDNKRKLSYSKSYQMKPENAVSYDLIYLSIDFSEQYRSCKARESRET